MTPPRQFKLPSELEDGETGRVERREYRHWRSRMLATEQDDMALRARLLEEEAEMLRARASARATAGAGTLGPADWDRRLQAQGRGEEAEPLPGAEQVAEFEEEARELEAQAAEVRTFLAEPNGPEDIEDHLKAVQTR